MCRCLCWLMLVSISFRVEAQEFSEKKRLYDLLEVRKHMFEDYLASLDRKSGFFGNRTRNDLRGSMDVLKEIIDTDNKIIGLLNRAIDFKVFEKSKMNYDLLDRDQQLQNYRHQAEALQKQLDALRAEQGSRSRIIVLQWLLLLVLAGLFIIYYIWKARRA